MVEDNLYDRRSNLVMTLVLVVICICGLIGNDIVLAVGIHKRKYQKNVTNCYILNLSLTDFLFLLISVPLTAYLGIIQTWIFGQFLCKMHIYLAHVFLHATCYTLAAMSIDRYLHIVHTPWYRRYRKPMHAQLICLLIWTVSGIFMFPYEHFWNANTEKHNQSSSTSECVVHETDALSSSCLFTLVFYYILPLSIIGLCYLRVSMHIRRTGYCMVKRTSGAFRQSIKLKRRRVQRMLLGLTLAFALCWLPIHVLELLSCSQLLSDSFSQRHFYVLNTMRMVAHALSYFNSCLNPFLYAILNNRFFSDHP